MSERVRQAADDAGRLDTLLSEAVDYFLQEPPDLLPGLCPDGTRPDSPCSIAAVGFALSSYAVAAEIGLIPRDEAVRRVLRSLRLFADSEQSDAPDATGYHGFYYHFLDRRTGRRVWQCELSSIDTALFLMGALTAGCSFDADTPDEREIRDLAQRLYDRTEWDWMLAGGDAICHGWKPECGFLSCRWTGYSEGLLLYLLALGSETHPIRPECYTSGWTSTYRWRELFGIEYLHAGPLFIHQMPHCWIDFRGIQDAAMRERGIDYFENSRRAVLVQREYAIHNPRDFRGYGAHCWGLTACEGPGPARLRIDDGREIQFFDYVARGVPDGPDDGTIAPWAVIASLPFAPEIVLPTIERFAHSGVGRENPYGFETTFNPTFPVGGDSHDRGWISPYNYGINQGPIVLMIENYRSDRVWRRMRACPYMVAGLRRAGFTGGWLENARF